MQTELDLLNELSQLCKTGADLATFEPIMCQIDIRTSLILQTLGFNPNDMPHAELFRQTSTDRADNVRKIYEIAETHPEVTVPYAINTLCQHVNKITRQQLLAFATDFSGGRTLQFTISFTTFATTWSSLHPETEKQKVQKQLQKLTKEGFEIIKAERDRLAISDCDKNRELLKSYCQNLFGVEPNSIETRKNIIKAMRLSVPYANLKTQTSKRAKSDEKVKTNLTANNTVRLSKLIADAKFALGSYQTMANQGHGNLILANIRSYIHEMESITNVHGQIWHIVEDEVHDIRAQNREIQQIEQAIEKESLSNIIPNLRDMITDLSNHADKLAAAINYYVDSFTFHEYNQAILTLSPNNLQTERPSISLNGVYVDDDDCFYAFNTPENLEKIMAKIREGLPSAEIKTLQVKSHKGFMFISEIQIATTNPMDMKFLKKIPLQTN